MKIEITKSDVNLNLTLSPEEVRLLTNLFGSIGTPNIDDILRSDTDSDPGDTSPTYKLCEQLYEALTK